MDDLRKLLPGLPSKLRDAGRYVADHEFDATTRSMRDIAASARLQPALFTRLAQAVGRSGWEEFRNELIEAKRPDGPFSSRIARNYDLAETPDDCGRLIAKIIGADSKSLTRIDVASISRAAQALHIAPKVWLAGFRSCRSVAMLLYYQLRLFRGELHLVGGAGAEDFDFGEFRSGDAVVVISFAPYSRTGLATVREALRAQCTLISITDRANSAMTEGADHSLIFDAGSTPAFFPSLTGATSIAQALAAGVFRLGKEESATRLRKTESRLSALAQYVQDEVTR